MKDVFIPDGAPLVEAFRRVKSMAIGAHQDDLEIFAYHGIEEAYRGEEPSFAGVTVTDGGGSARAGPYREFTDEQMKRARHAEQREAARIGRYSVMVQLGYPSAAVKAAQASASLVDELESLLRECRPETLYLHNPADKHDTHVATLCRCLEALRRLPPEARPQRIYGCEVWRDLDWLPDEEKICLPAHRNPELAERLIRVFESQILGGKDYARATLGRRWANATFFAARAVDEAPAFTVAMDLKPLLDEPELDLKTYALQRVERFRADVAARIQNFDNRKTPAG